MARIQRRYSKDEFARRGDQVFDTQVRPHLTSEDEGKFAAVDIESGNYELDEDELVAGDKLRARLPEAQIWMVRVGSRYVRHFGGRLQGYELNIQVRSHGKVRIKRIVRK